jgi:hypothetical protein
MDDFFHLALGMAAGILLGMMIILASSESHNTIIENGYGQYCPDTGDFAFTGECE